MSFLSTTGYESVFRTVDKAVDAFLVEVEGFVLFVLEGLNVVDVDESIEGRGYDVVQIWVELDLGDPALVDLPLNYFDVVLLYLKADWLLLHQVRLLLVLLVPSW